MDDHDHWPAVLLGTAVGVAAVILAGALALVL